MKKRKYIIFYVNISDNFTSVFTSNALKPLLIIYLFQHGLLEYHVFGFFFPLRNIPRLPGHCFTVNALAWSCFGNCLTVCLEDRQEEYLVLSPLKKTEQGFV